MGENEDLAIKGRPKIVAKMTLELDEYGGLMVDGEGDPVVQVRMAEQLIEGIKARGFAQYVAMKAAQQQKIVAAPASALNGKLGKFGTRSN